MPLQKAEPNWTTSAKKFPSPFTKHQAQPANQCGSAHSNLSVKNKNGLWLCRQRPFALPPGRPNELRIHHTIKRHARRRVDIHCAGCWTDILPLRARVKIGAALQAGPGARASDIDAKLPARECERRDLQLRRGQR